MCKKEVEGGWKGENLAEEEKKGKKFEKIPRQHRKKNDHLRQCAKTCNKSIESICKNTTLDAAVECVSIDLKP